MVRSYIAELNDKLLLRITTDEILNGCTYYDTKEFSAKGVDKERKIFVFVKRLFNNNEVSLRVFNEVKKALNERGFSEE